MICYILNEGVLNDDFILLPEQGLLKGGYIAEITYYTYNSPWSNNENKIRFRKEERLKAYLSKWYPEFEY